MDTVTRASVEAWIAAARGRVVKPATVINLIARVRGSPVGLPPWCRGVCAAGGGAAKAGPVHPAHLHRPGARGAVAQTDRCHYCSEVPYRHLVMPVLFRMIYACGLRCSEARLLHVEDVDVETGVLQIRDAKGGKDRQLPVSQSRCARGSPATTPRSWDSQAGSGSSPAPPRMCR